MNDRLILAAKSIRAELQGQFPVTEFRIRCRRYAGGNSVHVSWADGPKAAEVEALTRKYEEGYFDGNSDSYVYDEDPQHKEFHRLRGSTKYVMLQRRRAA